MFFLLTSLECCNTSRNAVLAPCLLSLAFTIDSVKIPSIVKAIDGLDSFCSRLNNDSQYLMLNKKINYFNKNSSILFKHTKHMNNFTFSCHKIKIKH